MLKKSAASLHSLIIHSFIFYIVFSFSSILVSLPCFANPTPYPACEAQLSKEMCSKIGQMLIIGFGGLNQDEEGKILWEDPNGTVFKEDSNIAKAIKNQYIGGVILFSREFRQNKTGEFLRHHNIKNPEQLTTLNAALREYSKQTRKTNQLEDLELIVSIDQEGGMINRLPPYLGFKQQTLIAQAFGTNEEMAIAGKELSDNHSNNKLHNSSSNSSTHIANNSSNTKDIAKLKETALQKTRNYAEQMAQELNALNINVNFAPCVDVNIDPLNFVLGGRGRCFSANPEIVLDQALTFVQAFNKNNIIATLKHFPGHGSSSDDSHVGLVDVTDTYKKSIELAPYQGAIKQGYQDLIMTTHVINGQIDKTQCKAGAKEDRTTWCPGTLSYTTLTTLLREQLGFKGVIVSDDMTMAAITNEYPLEVAFEKGINAGVDMFIIANNTADQTTEVVNIIAHLVKEGKVKESQIERAYNNIVALKKRMKQRMKE